MYWEQILYLVHAQYIKEVIILQMERNSLGECVTDESYILLESIVQLGRQIWTYNSS